MGCERPMIVRKDGYKPNGKMRLKFLTKYTHVDLLHWSKLYGYENLFVIPCGKCPSCIKRYKRQWALRCEAEARAHETSCFVTLTYDSKHNPGVLVKDHLKDFIKKLRNRGIKVRYFGCGEYASQPHYHIILFGYMPDDLSLICKSKTGFFLFKSKFIENIWKKGLCTVQEFDSAVAGYVAGYVDKKIDYKDSFLIMSNRPGIGYEYYINNLDKLYKNDNYIGKNGFISPLPRYVDRLAEEKVDLDSIKENRLKKSFDLTLSQCLEHGFEKFEDVFSYLGEVEGRKKKYARSL